MIVLGVVFSDFSIYTSTILFNSQNKPVGRQSKWYRKKLSMVTGEMEEP